MTLEKHLEAARIEYLRLRNHVCQCDLEEYTGRAKHNALMAVIFEGLANAEDEARLSFVPSPEVNTGPSKMPKKAKTKDSE